MKESYKAFLSIAAIIAGLIVLQYYFVETINELWYERAPVVIAGVGLLASGLTYFWTRSKFYK